MCETQVHMCDDMFDKVELYVEMCNMNDDMYDEMYDMYVTCLHGSSAQATQYV